MGNLSKRNYIRNANFCRKTSYSFTVKTGLYPYTSKMLFPLTGRNSYTLSEGRENIAYRSSDSGSTGWTAYMSGNNTITFEKSRVISGYSFVSPLFISENIDVEPNATRVFNQQIYPTTFFSFTNTEAAVGISDATMTLDLSGYNYNAGEDWTTQTKIYVLKITETGTNGTGKFVLKHYPLIENNNDYLSVTGAKSLFSESVPLYINSSNRICFHGTSIELVNYTNMVALWAESRRRDPAVKDDYISLILKDANTLQVYDYYFPFLPAKEKEITLADYTTHATWVNGDIYTIGGFSGVKKIDYSTEAVTDIAVPSGEYISLKYFYMKRQHGYFTSNYSVVFKFNGITMLNVTEYYNRSFVFIVDKDNNVLHSTTNDTEIINLLQAIYNGDYSEDFWLFSMFSESNTSIHPKVIQLGIAYSGDYTRHALAIGRGSEILFNDTTSVGNEVTKENSFSTSFTELVAHPDQDYVYLINESTQNVIKVSDNSVITTTHDLVGITDLMPTFDEEGNVWIGKYKFAKADLSLLYEHANNVICNYNFIIDSDNRYFDLDGVSLDTGNYPNASYSSTASISVNPDITLVYANDVFLVEGNYNISWQGYSAAGGGSDTSVHMNIIFENLTTGESFSYEKYSYFGNWSTRTLNSCFITKGTYTIKFQNLGDWNEQIRNLNINSTPISLGLPSFSTLSTAIKRYPQTWLFPYNVADLSGFYNKDTWFDSLGAVYDEENDAYIVSSDGITEITDGVKIIVDDNDGYAQVVEGDYFYFVVSGRGVVLDNWTDANIKLTLNPWDYTEYTKAITIADTTYTIEEKADPDFIELNYHIISGTWNDGTPISFSTSSPIPGRIQIELDRSYYAYHSSAGQYVYKTNYGTGRMYFHADDVGRVATITYHVGFTR